jgi:hypothetical protein
MTSASPAYGQHITSTSPVSTFIPLNSFSYRGSGGLAIYGPWAEGGSVRENRRRLLCAGAVLGACRLRHSAALSVGRITFVCRRGTWCIFSFQTDVQGLGDTDGLRDYPESLLRASWEPPESFLESFLESILESFLESFLRSFLESFLKIFLKSFLESFLLKASWWAS